MARACCSEPRKTLYALPDYIVPLRFWRWRFFLFHAFNEHVLPEEAAGDCLGVTGGYWEPRREYYTVCYPLDYRLCGNRVSRRSAALYKGKSRGEQTEIR